MGRPRIEGVQRRPDGKFRIRGEYVDGKTGRRREIDRVVRARDEIEAASILAKLRDEAVALRGERKPDRTRLCDALAAWRRSKALTLRPSTADRYDTAIEKWSAAIGEYFVDRVTPDDVRAVLVGWHDLELATETINGRLRILRSFAIETGQRRITDGVRALPPDIDEEEGNEDEGRGLDAAELRALLAAGPTAARTPKGKVPKWWPRAWALVATLAWTGLRFGEASALRWEDVDLEAGVLRVRRAQWRGIVGHPKARASKRSIALPEPLVAILREHRETMLRGQLAGVDSPLAFPSRIRGTSFVSNTYARKSMLTACAAAKVDLGVRPALHSLRHALNNLVRQVASEEVRRSIIGHAAEVETYTNVTRDEQRAAIGAVVHVLRGGS